MKHFDPNMLFICSIGNTYESIKNGEKYINFDDKGFSVVIQHRSWDYKYIDAFSNIEYVIFGNWHCDAGDKAINNPVSLTLFIQKSYDLFKNSTPTLQKVLDKIIKGKIITELDIKKLLFYLNNEKEMPDKKNIFQKNININIYTDLSKKQYKLTPCFRREFELNELIVSLAEKKSHTILIGENGVGKTTIIDGLIYKIKKNDVPIFLKKQKIFKLDLVNLNVSNNIEEKLINLIAYCVKNNIMLFIDDIEKIYEYKINHIIKEAINKKDLKVIGTTTIENYNKYFYTDDFTKIFIDEPNNSELNFIIKNVIANYINTSGVMFDFDINEEIINLLIDFTKKDNRMINTNIKIVDEKCSNPYLVIQIIDKMFAHSTANNHTNIEASDVSFAISSCNKIDDNIKKEYIKKINNYFIDKNTTQHKLKKERF